MKKLSLFALAAAGLLLGACSDKDDLSLNQAAPAETSGSSFVGIAISMPSAESNATRANDDLNNGEAEEFEVHSAYLFLFKGNEEATSTILGRWELTNDFKKDDQEAAEDDQPQTAIMNDDGTGITSTSVSVAKIDDLSLLPSENLYAYVIVNPANDAQKAKPADGTTFADFSKAVYARTTTGGSLEGVIAETGLMMTNSPVSNTQGGSNNPKDATIITAYKLDQTKIAKTAEAAKNAPAGCIFVERSTAKVTITEGTNLGTTISDGATGTIPFEIDGWQVINVEPNYYNVRQANESAWLPYFNEFMTTSSNKWRFVTKYDFDPTLPTDEGHLSTTDVYRTYFGKDIQYDKDATLDKTIAIDNAANWIAKTGRAYVPENTFDVARQIWNNTTQVTLRVKFNNGNDLYTISNDALYYTAATIDASLAAKVTGLYGINKFREDAKEFVLDALHDANPSKYYKAQVTVTATVPKSSDTTPAVASNSLDYTLEYTITAQESDTEEGTYADIAAADIPALNADLEGIWEDAVESAKEDYTVALYKGGYSYYNVRIQHFGEAETPWEAVAAATANADAFPFKVQPGGNVANIYGYTDATDAQAKANARFLGRYGVVRDNWYKLSIDKISKLGSAVPEDVEGNRTPDDEIEEEYYISAHVHIVPWVLRTQSVKF
jgi:hypothetical protein